MPVYSFQITIHARSPAVASGGPAVTVAGRAYPTLVVPHKALGATFSLSFENVVAALSGLPRMFAEPDGSFVWVSPSGESAWQVDGVLYDRDGRLLLVDLKGTCTPAAFDQILTACGWPETPVMFQLTREAVYVDEATFRALATG